MERLRDLTEQMRAAAPAKIFARVAIALIRSSGRLDEARDFAATQARGAWADTPAIDRSVDHAIRMAAVPGAGTDLSDAERSLWSDPSTAFISDVRAASVVGRLQGVTNVRFHRSAIETSSAVGAGWVRAGFSIPVRRSLYSVVGPLSAKKVAGLVVASSELASTPIAEANLGADLRRACVEQLDRTFCADGAGDSATPAGIRSGATVIASSGSTVAAISADLSGMVDAQFTGGGEPTGSVWIVPAHTWALYRLLKIADADGELAGLPVIVSAAATKVTLLAARQLVIAMGDSVQLAVSNAGMVEMSDAPTGATVTPTAASATPVSLFQTNSVALRASIPINWAIAGPTTSDGKAAVVVLGP